MARLQRFMNNHSDRINDHVRKKENEVTEEIKEARQLTEEELENLNGGVEIIDIGCSGMTHSSAAAEE